MKYILLLLLTLLIGYLSYTLWFQFGRAPRAEALTNKIHTPSQWVAGEFQNEIDTPTQTGDFSYWNMIKEMVSPSSKHRSPSTAIPSEHSDLKHLPQESSSIVWFGHSSYLLTLDHKTILVDPVFSGHSSPFPFAVRSFVGTDIYDVNDLPEIDVLLITHDHYDHLDYETVSKLKSKVKHVVTPLGVGEHLRFWGYAPDRITELNWHESVTLNDQVFTATPARHFSGRSFSRNKTLWASFVIQSPQHKVYVGGDSGYGPHFKAIGQQYGPFDLAMLESGQYNDSWKYIHMMPEETVQAAQDLNTKVLFPVHWGKFVLSLHDWDEPIQRLTAAAAKQQQALMTPKLGEITLLDQPHQQKWWQAVELNTSK